MLSRLPEPIIFSNCSKYVYISRHMESQLQHFTSIIPDTEVEENGVGSLLGLETLSSLKIKFKGATKIF